MLSPHVRRLAFLDVASFDVSSPFLALVVYRIWRIDREISKSYERKRSKLHDLLRVIIESGLLYTAFAFLSFITYVAGGNYFYLAKDMVRL